MLSNLLRPGTGNQERLGASHPTVKRRSPAELPRDVRNGQYTPPADENPLVGRGKRSQEPPAVRGPCKPLQPVERLEHRPCLLSVDDEQRLAVHHRELSLRGEG